MARIVTVSLGGEDRVLKFTAAEAMELNRHFNKPMRRLMAEDICPTDGAGQPTYDFNHEAVIYALYMGLRHIRKMSLELAVRWFTEAIGEGGDGAVSITNQIIDAMYLSGIVRGYSVDLHKEMEPEKAAAEDETPEGKAVRPPDAP
jgi:hypothetical protein